MPPQSETTGASGVSISPLRPRSHRSGNLGCILLLFYENGQRMDRVDSLCSRRTHRGEGSGKPARKLRCALARWRAAEICPLESFRPPHLLKWPVGQPPTIHAPPAKSRGTRPPPLPPTAPKVILPLVQILDLFNGWNNIPYHMQSLGSPQRRHLRLTAALMVVKLFWPSPPLLVPHPTPLGSGHRTASPGFCG